jgi:ABC-2 type transport system permease protein
MLWHKGWLETRLRLLFMLAWEAIFLGTAYLRGVKDMASFTAVLIGGVFLGAFVPIFLAGAGINTQASFQPAKGLHGSMLFTLSMPVSRLRLLAVRAGIGWLEMAAAIATWCCAVWFLFPILRTTASAPEVFEHAGTTLVCTSCLYAASLLLSTFLDDLWSIYGSVIVFVMFWWFLNRDAVPASLNIFRAMGESSPLIAHTMPWTAMGFSLALAAALFGATVKVVRAREY